METAIARNDIDINESFDGFLECATKALRHGDKIPKKLIKACAGMVLLNAAEMGVALSGQAGLGVAIAHNKDGKWSNPIAVSIMSTGLGVVFGYADKSIIMLLNHFAMKKLLQGQTSLSIGVDAGFAVGRTGRAASADVELSSKGGLGSSLVYTYSKGLMFSLQAVMGARLDPPNAPNEEFYGTSNYADILDGKVTAPEGSKVPLFLEMVEEFEDGPEVDESAED